MDKLRNQSFNNCRQEAVQTNQALVSLSMSVSLFAYNNMPFKRRTIGREYEWYDKDEDIDYLMDLKAERKQYKHPSFNELLEIFPEAKTVAKRCTKEQMIKVQGLISNLGSIRNTELERIYRDEKPRYHSACVEGVDNGIAFIREKYERELRILSWRLSSFDKKAVHVGFTPDDIARAKSFPMDSLIEIGKDGKALCVWHSERTPSMHYYKKTNNIHCFGCNKSGDTIDAYRAIHNVSFNMAVKSLL